MRLPLHQVDAFAARPFEGNPAAVVPLERWLDDDLLQAIAAENNLSETAFVVLVREQGRYPLRWFTPAAEVDLCGHATLAAAHVLRAHHGRGTDELRFDSRSGELVVRADGELLELDFPARPGETVDPDPALAAALGARVVLQRDGPYVLAELEDEAAVRALEPDLAALLAFGPPVIATAAADGPDLDFVSRFFAPGLGVPEDPVTGSAHCTLAPHWAARLGRSELRARQVSRRGGDLRCRLAGDRVRIAGRAVEVLVGELRLP